MENVQLLGLLLLVLVQMEKKNLLVTMAVFTVFLQVKIDAKQLTTVQAMKIVVKKMMTLQVVMGQVNVVRRTAQVDV